MIGWEGVPKKTKSIVLVAQNANSNEEVFWLAYNIDASLDVFEIPKADKDTWQFGRNSTGRTEFNWPCAKKTKVSAQKIKVTAYALSVKTPPFFVPPTKNDVLNAAQGSILEQATFIFQ